MFRHAFFFLLILSFPVWVNAQYERKSLNAVRCEIAPKIDGELNDACWMNAPKAQGFVADRPVPGVPMEHPSEVQVVYDDEAVYIAFMNFDPAPDSILKQLSGRDNDGNSDYCGITFSCYQDGVNGLSFGITPNAEQWDARETNATGEDVSWNAVWYCKTNITANGWIAEFKIPFAAIRFPDREVQHWNINFWREIRRIRQHGFWNGVDPEVAGYLTQFGTLEGIRDIKPPKRIFFSPYASFYQDFVEVGDGTTIHKNAWNAGMDLKVGLNDAFTLDATLIPDYGQVISDQRVLNLTPFEIQFQDNRQFFIEGTELFNKANIFYSRRIGYDTFSNLKLTDGEELVSAPGQNQLINASKISGRNKNGLGIGFFNAVGKRTFAQVRDSLGNIYEKEYSPLTNYNVLVLDQNLRNNSYFALVNTNVTRNGESYDANVIGTDFDLRTKNNRWSLAGKGAFSSKYGGDFKDVGKERQGFSSDVSFNKIDGNWRITAGNITKSDTYDPNDLGYISAPNTNSSYVWVQFNRFKPFWKLNRVNTSGAIYYNRLYNPNVFTDIYLESYSYITTKKFTTYNITYTGSPMRGFDYFEPRVEGKYFQTFRYNNYSGWISTDYRKVVALDAGGGYSDYENDGRYVFNWNVSPRWRASDRLMIIYSYRQENHFNDLGFATFENATPIFGRRDVKVHSNTLTMNYAFTPVMTLNCRVRHYWGYSKYKEFFNLADNGELTFTDFQGFIGSDGSAIEHSTADRSFTSFTIDLFYKWIFQPGSEINVVWKNSIIDSAFGSPVPVSLAEEVNHTFTLPQSNSFSIKVIYFLDYRSLISKKNRA